VFRAGVPFIAAGASSAGGARSSRRLASRGLRRTPARQPVPWLASNVLGHT
jgi:hypothetical protein